MTVIADLLIALRFLSRLPVPATARERALGAGGFAAAAALAPMAGLVLAVPPAAVLAGAAALRLPAQTGAVLAIAAAVALTGAMHEDALADCADGFGGGRTRERKLAIMRDSRIGAYGAAALALSLLVRTSALAALAGDLRRATIALFAAAALSRAAALMPLALLPAARADGAGAAARTVGVRRFLAACALAATATILLGGLGRCEPARVAAASVAAAAAAWGWCVLARRQIGGQTGDVAGAAQQAAEAAVLLVFAAGPP